MTNQIFNARIRRSVRICLCALVVLSVCSFPTFAVQCPVPTRSVEINYDKHCWTQSDYHLEDVRHTHEQSGGGRRGVLNGYTDGFRARVGGVAVDSSIGGQVAVSVAQTAFRYEEWRNLATGSTAGGKVTIRMTGTGKGELNLVSHAASGYGYLKLSFDSNLLGTEVWERSLSKVAASKTTASPISVSVPGPRGTSTSIRLDEVHGLGGHRADPFDLGVKIKRGCTDAWHFNQVGVFSGELRVNGSFFRTARATSCFQGDFKMRVQLSCGC